MGRPDSHMQVIGNNEAVSKVWNLGPVGVTPFRITLTLVVCVLMGPTLVLNGMYTSVGMFVAVIFVSLFVKVLVYVLLWFASSVTSGTRQRFELDSSLLLQLVGSILLSVLLYATGHLHDALEGTDLAKPKKLMFAVLVGLFLEFFKQGGSRLEVLEAAVSHTVVLGDAGSVAAWSFWSGYLQDVLVGFSNRVYQDELIVANVNVTRSSAPRSSNNPLLLSLGDDDNGTPMYLFNMLFILVPHQPHPGARQFHADIQSHVLNTDYPEEAALSARQVDRSGVLGRAIGRHSVRRIEIDETICFVMFEFASPCRTLSLNDHLTDAQVALQCEAFYHTLRDIWRNESTHTNDAFNQSTLRLIYGENNEDTLVKMRASIEESLQLGEAGDSGIDDSHNSSVA